MPYDTTRNTSTAGPAAAGPEPHAGDQCEVTVRVKLIDARAFVLRLTRIRNAAGDRVAWQKAALTYDGAWADVPEGSSFAEYALTAEWAGSHQLSNANQRLAAENASLRADNERLQVAADRLANTPNIPDCPACEIAHWQHCQNISQQAPLILGSVAFHDSLSDLIKRSALFVPDQDTGKLPSVLRSD